MLAVLYANGHDDPRCAQVVPMATPVDFEEMGPQDGNPQSHLLRIGEDLQLVAQSLFSAWPPNCMRMAERRRFANEPSSRLENRE